jgi:hypothetical protein
MTAIAWVWVGLSAGVVLLTGLLARRFVVNPATKKPFRLEANDFIPLSLGFIGMVISALLEAGQASVWSYFIDLGSFAVGTSLVVTSPPKSWPRLVGLLVLGIHIAQVLATNSNAPLIEYVDLLRGVFAG